MDETNRNSMKLDIEAVRLSENDHDQPTETYKQVSEFSSNEKSTGQVVANMTREKSDNVEDGADEKMLDVDEKQQLARKDEVKFIASDRSNGDAKIDIGNIEKSFTGMTKEELMKYANDPFWQRLRWIFFISFWLLWAAMLAGAVWIILKAPKCSVAKPLPWYKEGPLIEMPKNVNYQIKQDLIEKLKSIGTKGVIYNLPADKTYKLNETEVQKYIKEVINDFKNTDIKVIFDLTPNYVDKENRLFKDALTNETLRSAFVWKETAMASNNWVSKIESNREGNTAWQKLSNGNHVLSQFGPDNIDLQMSDPFAREMFKDVLKELAEMGVKGFRLANAKHYIISTEAPNDEISSQQRGSGLKDYAFFTHAYTTNQPGLGQLLHEFSDVVRNATNGEGFLSVTDYIDRPDVFSTEDGFGFELPILLNLTTSLQPTNDGTTIAKKLYQKLHHGLNNTTWQQWPLGKLAVNNGTSRTSASNIFLYLLPGVPIGSILDFNGIDNATVNEIKALGDLRKSPSYQHGDFESHLGHNDSVIAYTRLKLGNPGFFVVYNPTNANITANFKNITSLPDQLSKIDLVSVSHKDTTETVPTDAVPLPASSAVVFRYAKTNA